MTWLRRLAAVPLLGLVTRPFHIKGDAVSWDDPALVRAIREHPRWSRTDREELMRWARDGDVLFFRRVNPERCWADEDPEDVWDMPCTHAPFTYAYNMIASSKPIDEDRRWCLCGRGEYRVDA